MEVFALPLVVVAMGFFFWMMNGGPNSIFVERRKTAEANARAEELRLERA